MTIYISVTGSMLLMVYQAKWIDEGYADNPSRRNLRIQGLALAETPQYIHPDANPDLPWYGAIFVTVPK